MKYTARLKVFLVAVYGCKQNMPNRNKGTISELLKETA